MIEPIMLFLDINGVIDWKESGKIPEQIYKNEKGTPVPGAKEFLQVIDNCPWICPVWISSWGWASQAWNKWSQTRLWDVAYSFGQPDKKEAKKLFPDADGKFLALRWYSRNWDNRIVWLEDRLSQELKLTNWIQNNPKNQIIDTYPNVKQWRKGYQAGIRYWNIEQISDILDIQGENREILLNHIKSPFVDLLENQSENIINPLNHIKSPFVDLLENQSENIINPINANQELIPNKLTSTPINSVELLGNEILLPDQAIDEKYEQGSIIAKIWNWFKSKKPT